jgi:hypothetical protein
MNLKDHYSAVAEMGCIVCKMRGLGNTPAELHHPWGRKGDNERKVLPLCFSHHRSGVKTDLFVSRHPYKKEFERRYGTETELLAMVDKWLSQK